MDHLTYRSAGPRLRRVAGLNRPVGIKPLSRSQIDEAIRAVDDLWSAYGAARGSGPYRVAVCASILRTALTDSEPPFRPLSCIDGSPCLIESLFEAWRDVQQEHWPDTDRLEAEVTLQFAESEINAAAARQARMSGYPEPVFDDTPLASDAISAAVSKTPGQFFGLEEPMVTDAQLAYWLTLRAVHQQVTDPDNEEKCTSLEHLKKQAGR